MTIPKSVNLIITIVAVALFFVSGIGVGLMIQKSKISRENKEATLLLNANPIIKPVETKLSENDIKAIFENLPVAERKVSDDIKWMTTRQISSFHIFEEKENDLSREEMAKYYQVGRFIDGKYKGGDLILISAGYEGPAFYPGFYRFVKNGDSLVFLKKYSDELYDGDGFIKSKFTIDEEYDIPELNYPKYIKGPNQRQYLEQDESVRALMDLSNLKISIIDPIFGNIYMTDDRIREQTGDIFTKNGFYIEAPDGTVRAYFLKIDIIDKKNVPEITWSDGAINSLEYVYSDVGGCGARNYASVAPMGSDANNKDRLEIIGKTSKGDDVYSLKDKNHYFYKDFYDNVYRVFDDSSQSTKVSYEKFVADRPLFYWVDPFGRTIKFQNNKFIPQTECGKPVIYLYPEKETEISVKVEPKGGLGKSDPEYGNGWRVLADPKGELTELKTGKKYPYLFWEGRGGIYEQPKQGFLVERNNVHRFLIEKLVLLGLNEKEKADFMEFWEQKMQSAPYYFVTFLGNREMDALAPLEISPKPDTIIRVLMDFSPLDQPIKTQEYEIKTPKRDGFTAVEWGGVIR